MAMAPVSDLKISLNALCQQLKKLGHVDAEQLAEINQSGLNGKQHPAQAIASHSFKCADKPAVKLDEEFIMTLLADEAKLALYTVDPLKVKASEVTPTMSFAFAKRHGLLPVELSADTVTVATAEPFDQRWIADIEHINRRQVKMVVATPSDIQRYQVEFFSLAASVSGATELHKKQGSNLE